MPEIDPPSAAPGELEFVRAFINTRDIDLDTDRLADPDGWSKWAHEQGLDQRDVGGRLGEDGEAADATEAELQRARELREILRQSFEGGYAEHGHRRTHRGGPPYDPGRHHRSRR